MVDPFGSSPLPIPSVPIPSELSRGHYALSSLLPFRGTFYFLFYSVGSLSLTLFHLFLSRLNGRPTYFFLISHFRLISEFWSEWFRGFYDPYFYLSRTPPLIFILFTDRAYLINTLPSETFL